VHFAPVKRAKPVFSYAIRAWPNPVKHPFGTSGVDERVGIAERLDHRL
jgi:hypothetical protein